MLNKKRTLMKRTINLLSYILVVCIAIGSAACDGDQGEIGPKGDKGDTGATGSKGTDGDDGAGFEELTQYGHIELTMTGKRIDNVNFAQTADFNYMPYDGVTSNSYFYHYDNDDADYFTIVRENKGKVTSTINGRTEDGGMKNMFGLDLTKDATGFKVSYLKIYADVVSPDFKVFEINYSDASSWNNDFDVTLSNLSYAPTTGKLIFNFSYTIPAANSPTGYDILLTGKVDVIVFESLYYPV